MSDIPAEFPIKGKIRRTFIPRIYQICQRKNADKHNLEVDHTRIAIILKLWVIAKLECEPRIILRFDRSVS